MYINKKYHTTMTTDTNHTTTNTGAGKIRKVKTIRTSEEVREARIREKMERRVAKQQAMIQAVTQAVTLPEMPSREVVADIAPEPRTQPVEVHDDTTTLKLQVEKRVGKVAIYLASLFDRIRTFMLEEG